MIVAVVFSFSVLVYIAGTVATFLIVRSRSSEYEAFADFAGSFIFWWLMLPAFMVRVAWLAGHDRYQQIKASREPQPLQSGAENGLYDPV